MANASVVDQIVQSLAFEVLAIPQDDSTNKSNDANSTPLNVKIRVKKKEDCGMREGILSVPKFGNPDAVPERIRLISSDQTIMSFNMAMEADFAKKPKRKPRRTFFGGCLGLQYDEDDSAYLPSTAYSAKTADGSVSSKSDGVIKQNFTFSKTNDNTELQPYSRKPDILGKCKPGGCLDPPFGEEKYAYEPIKKQRDKRTVTSIDEETVPTPAKIKLSKRVNVPNSSFESKKSKDTLVTQKAKTKADDNSILSLYEANHKSSLDSKYSDSVITYPPDTSPSLTSNDKTSRSRVNSDEKQRKSFNESIDAFFKSPRKNKRISEKSSTGELRKNGKPKTDKTVYERRDTTPKVKGDISKTDRIHPFTKLDLLNLKDKEMVLDRDVDPTSTKYTIQDEDVIQPIESQKILDDFGNSITPTFDQAKGNAETDNVPNYIKNITLTQALVNGSDLVKPMLRTRPEEGSVDKDAQTSEKLKLDQSRQSTEVKQKQIIEQKQSLEPRQTIKQNQGIEPRDRIDSKQGADSRKYIEPIENINLRENTVLRQGIESRERMEPRQEFKPEQNIELRRGIQPSEFIEPVKNVESRQDIGPSQGIESMQGIEPMQGIVSMQGIELRQGIEPKQGTKLRQGIELTQDIEPDLGVQPKQSNVSRQGVEPRYGTVLRQGIEPRQDVDPKQYIESIRDVKPKQSIESRQGIEPRQEILSRQDAESKHSVQSKQAVESRQGIEPRQSTESRQDIEPRQSIQSRQGIESKLGIDPKRGIETRQSIESRQVIEPRPGVESIQSIESRLSTEPRQVIEPSQGIKSRQSIESRPNLGTRQVIEPRQGIKSRQSTESRQDTESRQSIKKRQVIDPRQGIKLQKSIELRPSIETRPVIESKQDIKSRQSIESKQSIKSRQGIEPTQSTEPKDAIEPKNGLEPRQRIESGQGIDTRQSFEPIQHTIKPRQDIELRKSFELGPNITSRQSIETSRITLSMPGNQDFNETNYADQPMRESLGSKMEEDILDIEQDEKEANTKNITDKMQQIIYDNVSENYVENTDSQSDLPSSLSKFKELNTSSQVKSTEPYSDSLSKLSENISYNNNGEQDMDETEIQKALKLSHKNVRESNVNNAYFSRDDITATHFNENLEPIFEEDLQNLTQDYKTQFLNNNVEVTSVSSSDRHANMLIRDINDVAVKLPKIDKEDKFVASSAPLSQLPQRHTSNINAEKRSLTELTQYETAFTKSSTLRLEMNLEESDNATYIDGSYKTLEESRNSLKKDTVSLDLAFHSYVNDKRERTVKSIDSTKEPIRYPNDVFTVIKSQIKQNVNEIRIPVDLENDMTIQIKRTRSPTHRVQIIEGDLTSDGKSAAKSQKDKFSDLSSSDTKDLYHKFGGAETQKVLSAIYEQELVPLQKTIKNLKQDIDLIVGQQSLLVDQLCSVLKSKPIRLLRVNPRCGCWRK